MKEITLQAQSKTNINWKIVIGSVFLLGLLSIFSPGSLFIFLLILSIILGIRLSINQDEKKFLVRIFIYGIVIRVSLVLIIQFIMMLQEKWTYYYGGDRLIVLFGDDGFNNIVSWWIAKYVSGKHLSDYLSLAVSSRIGEYGRSGYLYIVSLFHYLFNFSPVSVIFLNCIISAFGGIIYYYIARKISSIRSAKIIAVLVTFFPSLVIWSITNLKEPLFAFLIGIIFLLLLQLLKNIKISFLIWLFLSIILLASLRRRIFLPVVLALGLSYLISKQKTKILIFLLIIAFICIGFSWASLIKILDDFKLKTINYHLGVISSGGFTYHLYDDWVYRSDITAAMVGYSQLLKGFLKGWLYILFLPFPWTMSSKLSLASLPQMIIWYFLLPFAGLGMLMQLRHNWKKSLALIIYFLTVGSILALTGGNIGTDFRMRDMLTPVILLFSSIGLAKVFYLQKDVPVT